MSDSKRPLVADAIPVIDILDRQLTTMINDITSPTIIRASAAKGRAVLNRYYAKTDDSKMYRLCMSKLSGLPVLSSTTHHFVVLHPKFKMTYFHKENWQPDWIDTARQLLRDEWDKYYKPCINVSFLEEAGTTTNSSNSVTSSFHLCLIDLVYLYLPGCQ